MVCKEKLKREGVASLSDSELLAVILGSCGKKRDLISIANELEARFSDDFSKMTFESLRTTEGLGDIPAMRLSAACELFTKRKCIQKKITNPSDAVKLVENIRERRQEHFIVITLNGAGCLIHKRTVFIGTLNRSLVHPREVFADAISDRASGIILMHNHPSGDTEPSKEDILVTERLQEGAKILGIEIVDHIIFSSKSHYSFKE
ncbi:MAG: DNA repair protein RadC, partial [bacterium]